MVFNNVTKFHKILINNIRLRERTSFKTVNFHKQRAITAIWTIIELEEYIMVLNNVTKFHKIRSKSIRFRGNTLCPGHYRGGGIIIINVLKKWKKKKKKQLYFACAYISFLSQFAFLPIPALLCLATLLFCLYFQFALLLQISYLFIFSSF